MKPIQVIDAGCCPPVLEDAPLGDDQAERLAAALRVIAEPARLRLLSLIGSCPDDEACVCDLTEPLGLSQPTVSHHLRVLHEAGLLRRERRGSWVFYRLVPDGLRFLSAALGTPAPAAPPARAPAPPTDADPGPRPEAPRSTRPLPSAVR